MVLHENRDVVAAFESRRSQQPRELSRTVIEFAVGDDAAAAHDVAELVARALRPLAVELASFADNLVAESAGDESEAGMASHGDVAGDSVGIDDRGAELGEHRGDRALAACDSPCEANDTCHNGCLPRIR